jgi:RNA polymerase sigma factor (sigma-70 family)
VANNSAKSGNKEKFATTRWSLVLAAGHEQSPGSSEALATLCGIYWYPLYAFGRRLGHCPEEAQDLTQEFFVRVLEKGYLGTADPTLGRFRCFLLTSFKHFLSKERERAQTQKRGGGRKAVPLDFEAGERRYSLEPAHELTAEKLYEQRWALTVLDQVLARLRQEFTAGGKADLFEQLKCYLTGEESTRSYRAAAAELGMTEGAFKTAVHRVRRRFREIVLAEIAQTVAANDEVEEELRHLFAAIRLESTSRG